MPRASAAAIAALVLIACGASPEAELGPRALVLLTVDTLRADHLGAYGSDRGLTPNLDAWAKDSLVFEAAYTPTPFTVPALVSLHTGRHPLELGFQINTSELDAHVVTLAERLDALGWKTAAVVSNVVLQHRRDLAQGFQIYDDTMEQREAIRRWPERIAHATTDAALKILTVWQNDASASEHPLFLWVHYQDPHGPYLPPPGFRERYLARERARDPRHLSRGAPSYGEGGIPRYQQIDDEDAAAFYHAGYDGEIAYLDSEMGRLLDALRERDLATRVVIAADHGESMGENDLWFSHANDLTDALVHVPLFVRLPGVAAGRRADVVRLADLYPTLLAAVSAGPASDAASAGDARDLLAPGAAQIESVPLLTTLEAYPHRRLGIVTEGYKLILTQRDGVWSPRLFRQGREDVDLAAPAPQVASQLRDRLWDLHDVRKSDTAARLLPIDDEQRKQLEALGYAPEPSP